MSELEEIQSEDPLQRTLRAVRGEDDIPPVRVKLVRNSKGYGWEITVTGNKVEEVLTQIGDADDKLASEYIAS